MSDETMTLLDLDDLSEPGAFLKISGETYHFVRWSGIGLIQRRQILKRQARMDELEKEDKPTKSDEKEYDTLTRELMPLICDAPASVTDSLDSEKRQDIASVFLGLRLIRRGQFLPAMKPVPDPSTTDSSAPASKGSGRRGKRSRG